MRVSLLIGFFAINILGIAVVFFKISTDCEDTTEILIRKWIHFKFSYNKSYNNATEEIRRFHIFKVHWILIQSHNLKYDNKRTSYKLSINEFTDMEARELQLHDTDASLYVDTSEYYDENMNSFEFDDQLEIPNEFDWRLKGAVTFVKNQLPCGSCYAFSAVGALEAQHFLKTGQLVSFSVQNVIDCSSDYGNSGCNGGFIYETYRYLKNGIETEQSYPYEAIDGTCHFNTSNIAAKCDDIIYVPKDEETLKQAVAIIGPISVDFHARPYFAHYKSGVINDPDCNVLKTNHAVLIVGYGFDDETNLDYWIVKNTFGVNWGDKGYFKLVRNSKNNCGITANAHYPYIKTNLTKL
ncbi:unnamed protein product [Diamesa serratosioi]